jgi:hypothetical protein
MPSDNKLELVIVVDVAKGNASIKTLNTGLSSIEQAASKAARGASAGIDIQPRIIDGTSCDAKMLEKRSFG